MTRAQQTVDTIDTARENTESVLRAVRGLKVAEMSVRDTAIQHLGIVLRTLNTLKLAIPTEPSARRCKR